MVIGPLLLAQVSAVPEALECDMVLEADARFHPTVVLLLESSECEGCPGRVSASYGLSASDCGKGPGDLCRELFLQPLYVAGRQGQELLQRSIE